MITFIEYATLSAHVYKPWLPHIGSIKFQELSTKNIIAKSSIKPTVDWYSLPDVDPYMKPQKSFYMQLYIKFDQGRAVDAVIAIRGTNNIPNGIVDVKSFSSDVLGDGNRDLLVVYLNKAMTYYNQCKKYLSTYFPKINQISVTGHSLGGAVAQLLPLHAAYASYAVCFNSPGCGHLPGVKKDHAGWVINVNAEYDFVSKVGLTLGKLYVVDVPNEELEAKKLFDSFDKKRFEESEQELADRNPLTMVNKRAEGYGNRLYGYIESLDKLNNTSELQKQYLKCQNLSKGDSWLLNKNYLLQSGCDLYSLSHEYTTIIESQHSINNMVAALQLPKNINIGNNGVI